MVVLETQFDWLELPGPPLVPTVGAGRAFVGEICW
jgi:hypothetical protein